MISICFDDELNMNRFHMQHIFYFVLNNLTYFYFKYISESGKLYTFGENENGKLGLREEQLKDTSRPQPVATKDGSFTAVACGSGHTIALTKDGKVYSFGDGSRGQLGQGTRVQELKEPGLIQQLSHLKVRSVSCGDCHSAVVTGSSCQFFKGALF